MSLQMIFTLITRKSKYEIISFSQNDTEGENVAFHILDNPAE